MKHSEILREAKKILWDGKGRIGREERAYICDALFHAGARNGVPAKAQQIRKQIAAALYPYGTLSGWLSCVHRVPPTERNCINMQEYRHRWLDELIRIYAEAGK